MVKKFKIGKTDIQVHAYKSSLDSDFGKVRELRVFFTRDWEESDEYKTRKVTQLELRTPRLTHDYSYEKQWTLLPTLTCKKSTQFPLSPGPNIDISLTWLKWNIPLIHLEPDVVLMDNRPSVEDKDWDSEPREYAGWKD